MGTSLAYLAKKYSILEEYLKKSISSVISLVGIAMGFFALSIFDMRYGNFICSFFGAFFVACLWNNEDSMLSKSLSNAFFRFAGKLTYSIYLIHVLVINIFEIILNKFNVHSGLTTFFLSYLASILLSFILNKYIEKRFIKLGRDIANSRIHRLQLA